MPRSLSMQRTVVTPGDRVKFLERMKARQTHYAAVGCHFWVFEEAALSGAFIEFTEAPDAATLKAAHAAAAEPPLDPARIYTIVDLP
ncbi:MAG: hypothetical protein NTW72_00200 [Gemmatimonadetes bacterium]|nr:hypothetical protein [Gemmatimonadota bacterium]